MKPVKLEFCGVNSFSEPQEINFQKLLEYGIFGIFGDTGSGKSTILDCIVFALYGGVPRLGTKEAGISNLINYRLDKAYVHFEFEIVYEGERRTFRAEREIKRKNSIQSLRVYERKEGALLALAEGARDGNALLERIIGLEQRDFEKCIALPQGEFSQFVKSQRSDRLKLISRLFNLERYGETLYKRMKEKYDGAQTEAELAKARLEPYAEYSEEGIAAAEREIATLTEEEKGCGTALSQAQEREKKLSTLFERKKRAEECERKFAQLEEKKPQMKALNDALSRLERAAAVIAAQKELETARKRASEAEEEFTKRTASYESVLKALQAYQDWNEERAQEELTRLREAVEEARRAGELRANAEKIAARLKEIDKEFASEAERVHSFSYEAEREKIEKRLSELQDESFLEFVEKNGKEGFLREEYAKFRDELLVLTQKYPVIGEDTAPLVERYGALSEGERTDFKRLREAFEAEKVERQRAQEALLNLEKAKGRYDMARAHMLQLETERREKREELQKLEPQLADTPDYGALKKKLDELTIKYRETAAGIKNAEKERAEAYAARAAAEATFTAAREHAQEAEIKLKEALVSGGFSGIDGAVALQTQFGNPESARERVEKYREDYAALRAQLREFTDEERSVREEEVLSARQEVQTLGTAYKECAGRLAVKREELKRAEKAVLEKKRLSEEFSRAHRRAELLERLKKLLEGNQFMEFVAEEFLQRVARHATERLLLLTDGRYRLCYDKGFLVGDNYNGGALRGVYTLSGGETFLVSLSLALALGAEICARSLRPIEFFFLDEGFGSLDERLVDTVMDSLEKLKGEHFSIGIISHVEELRRRIDRKLLVKKATDCRGSQITME